MGSYVYSRRFNLELIPLIITDAAIIVEGPLALEQAAQGWLRVHLINTFGAFPPSFRTTQLLRGHHAHGTARTPGSVPGYNQAGGLEGDFIRFRFMLSVLKNLSVCLP